MVLIDCIDIDSLTLTPAISRINLEGAEAPLQFSTLLEHPELRHIGSNQRCARPRHSSPLPFITNTRLQSPFRPIHNGPGMGRIQAADRPGPDGLQVFPDRETLE